jgi:aspartate/methionine/tyrosine aminotransferase
MLRLSSPLANVTDPPVAIAKNWIANRTFEPEYPLIDVSQAVPGIAPADALRSHMSELAGNPASARYAPALGVIETRTAIANSLADRHLSVDNVMVTAGCNQAFCLAVGALCEPGDEVIVPVPWYFNHDMWLQASGLRTVALPVLPEHGMLPDVEQCATLITSATRAIVLVTPNNPCGVEYPADLIRSFFDLARSHNVALILDETYKDFRSATTPAHDLFGIADWAETLVHLFSFSKVFSLAGYRIGSLTAAPHVLRSAVKLADCQTIAAATLSQHAVTFALANLESWVNERRVEMLTRVDAFRTEMAAAPEFEIVSSGAFFAYVRHPFSDSAAIVAKRLADEHNVLCLPGSSFGPHQQPFLRLAFGNIADHEMASLAERLRRFANDS